MILLLMNNSIRKFVCIGCGKEVEKSCLKTVKYCSFPCYRKHGFTGRKKNGGQKKCVVCGKEFYASKRNLDKPSCCSIKCQNIQQSKKVSVICEVCDKEFFVSPCFAKDGKRRFCSISCRDKSPKVKQRLIEMNLMQQSNKMTSLEKIGYKTLVDNKITFVAQKLLFNKFCVDAFIEKWKIVIQFDGDYWHGNPIKYKTLDKRQNKRKQLDISQDKYMKKAGICVIRVWESEMKKNPYILIEKIKNTNISKQNTLFPDIADKK